jgi:thiol-disulfide isomerase/thioredoxin
MEAVLKRLVVTLPSARKVDCLDCIYVFLDPLPFGLRQMMNASKIVHFIALLAAITSYVDSFTVNRVSCTRSSCLHTIAFPFKGGEKKKKRSTKPNVLHIESVEDYKQEVIDSSQITVVRFYSRYCKSCQASEPLFYKLARDFQENGVKFVEVPLTPQTNVLHEALGVPSLPWTHIYHPDAGLVEERKVSKKFIDEVRTCLRCYVYGECDLEDAPADCMEVYGECAVDDD